MKADLTLLWFKLVLSVDSSASSAAAEKRNLKNFFGKKIQRALFIVQQCTYLSSLTMFIRPLSFWLLLFISLSLSLCLFLSLCLSLTFSPSFSIPLAFSLSVCTFLSLSVLLSISVCLSLYLSFYLLFITLSPCYFLWTFLLCQFAL